VHHRDTGIQCFFHGCNCVGNTGAGGCEQDTRFAGDAGIGIRCIGSITLMPEIDNFDTFLTAPVEERRYMSTHQGENCLDPFTFERFSKHSSSIDFCHVQIPPCV